MLINNHLPESELVSKNFVQRKKIRVGVIKVCSNFPTP
jgi:hypothetical protein